MSAYYRGTTTVDFSQDFPVLSIVLPTSLNGVIDPAFAEVTGSSFRNSYMKNEIQQAQLKGDWKFTEKSRLDFGLSLTDVKNRSAFSNMEQDSWGGLGNFTSTRTQTSSLIQFGTTSPTSTAAATRPCSTSTSTGTSIRSAPRRPRFLELAVRRCSPPIRPSPPTASPRRIPAAPTCNTHQL